MCGITGIVNFDGVPVHRDLLLRMTVTLSHRGPDASSVWTRDNVGLGHHRLAIRDLSAAGLQPMAHPTKALVVTYNGEIYNDRQLRRAIEQQSALQFTSTCDTQVITPAYDLWGAAAFDRFEGMFAIAIWDAQEQQLVLARDACGIKPLYYTWDGARVRFASELKALLADHTVPRALSPSALHTYLAQGYPGPSHTLVEDIRPVPPGSYAVFSRQGILVRRYWMPRRTGEITDLSEALGRFRSLWPQVVQDMLVSDVPVGLLLSGGIDSALIATALKDRSARAFTARYTHKAFDETGAAAVVAAHAGLNHVTVPVDEGLDIEARFRKVVHHFDGNCADSSGFAFHAVCEAARKHVPVVLTGDGADEFFGGYETYFASRLARWLGWVTPRAAARGLSKAFAGLARRDSGRIPTTEKLARLFAGIGLGTGADHVHWRRHSYPDVYRALYGPGLADLADCDPLEEYAQHVRAASGTLVDRCMLADETYYLPGDLLVKSDAMSMAHGLEVRVPFLDRRVMELAGQIHCDLLVPLFGSGKRVLREALSSTGVDPSVVKGPKRGFNVPVAHYLRSALRPLGDRLLVREADVLSPYLSPDGVANLWREHQESKANHGYLLWTLLSLALWRETAGV